MPFTAVHRHRRSPPIVLAAAVCCLAALAGCGSSRSPNKTASNPGAQGIRFADCVRSHGVPNFPDPSTSGGGIAFKRSSGIDYGSPAFKAAESACGRLLPRGGTSASEQTAAAKAQMLAVSECMRAYGIKGFPDPSTGPPPNNAPDASAFEYNDGVFLAVPNSIDAHSPAFKRASNACHFGPPSRGQ
jgi:hypothetical protein